MSFRRRRKFSTPDVAVVTRLPTAADHNPAVCDSASHYMYADSPNLGHPLFSRVHNPDNDMLPPFLTHRLSYRLLHLDVIWRHGEKGAIVRRVACRSTDCA